MLKFLSEHTVSAAGTRLTLPVQSLFKSVVKVGPQFVVTVEVHASEDEKVVLPEHEVDIVVKSKNEYLHPKAKYIDTVVVGEKLFHFFAQTVELELEPEFDDENVPKQQDPSAPPPAEPMAKKIRAW
jgi:hypothetical protein